MTPESEIGSCSVAEVMGTELFTLTPDTAVASARRLVIENDIDHMLVLDNGTLAGIVCRDDLSHADRHGRVGDYMTSPVVCVTPDTTLQEAIDIMGANDIDCLPVVTGTFLVGMVTWNALASAELTPRNLDANDNGTADADDSLDDDEEDSRRGTLFGEEISGDPCALCGSLNEARSVSTLAGLSLCGGCRPMHARQYRMALA